MNNIAGVNKLRQLEESEQWLENVDQVGCKKVYTSSEFQSKTGSASPVEVEKFLILMILIMMA